MESSEHDDDDGDEEEVNEEEGNDEQDMDVGGSTNFDSENLQENPVISDVNTTTVPPTSEPEPTSTSEPNPSISEPQTTPPISNTETLNVSVPPNTSTTDTTTNETPNSPPRVSESVSTNPVTPPISLSQDSAFSNLEKIVSLPEMTPSVPLSTSTIDTPTSNINTNPATSEDAEFVEEEDDEADLSSGIVFPNLNLAPMVLDDSPPSADEEDKIVNKRDLYALTLKLNAILSHVDILSVKNNEDVVKNHKQDIENLKTKLGEALSSMEKNSEVLVGNFQSVETQVRKMVESSNPELEKKVADLEAEVAKLKGRKPSFIC